MFASDRRTCMRKSFKNWSLGVEWFEYLSLEDVLYGYRKKLLNKLYYISSIWMLIYRMFCKIKNIYNFFLSCTVNLRPMWGIKIVIIGWEFFLLFFFYIMLNIFNIFNYYSIHLFAWMAPIEFSQSYPTEVTF